MAIIIKLDRAAFIKNMWAQAEGRNLDKYAEKVKIAEAEGVDSDSIDELAVETCKRNIFYVIKNYGPYYEEPTTRERAEVSFETMDIAIHSISLLTPREFMLMFPIAKEFDGEKSGVKDYFSTMEYIDSIGMDAQIEEPKHFLFEYHNWEIFDFMMNYTGLISKKYEEANGISIFEKFCIENNVPVYEMPNWPSGEGE